MSRCKHCQSKLSKIHYQSNKQIYKNRARTRNIQILRENKIRLHAYLSTHPCVDCDKTDIRLLEFDHVLGQKIKDVSRLLAQRQRWSNIVAEISKCEVHCANCHRIKTFERDGDWWRGEFE